MCVHSSVANINKRVREPFFFCTYCQHAMSCALSGQALSQVTLWLPNWPCDPICGRPLGKHCRIGRNTYDNLLCGNIENCILELTFFALFKNYTWADLTRKFPLYSLPFPPFFTMLSFPLLVYVLACPFGVIACPSGVIACPPLGAVYLKTIRPVLWTMALGNEDSYYFSRKMETSCILYRNKKQNTEYHQHRVFGRFVHTRLDWRRSISTINTPSTLGVLSSQET